MLNALRHVLRFKPRLRCSSINGVRLKSECFVVSLYRLLKISAASTQILFDQVTRLSPHQVSVGVVKKICSFHLIDLLPTDQGQAVGSEEMVALSRPAVDPWPAIGGRILAQGNLPDAERTVRASAVTHSFILLRFTRPHDTRSPLLTS